MNRVVFDILLFLCLFTMPWWLTGVLALIGIFVWKQFYEFIFVWVIMYSLFAVPDTRFISSPIWYSLIVGVVYVGIQTLRRNMAIYKNEI